MTDEEIIALADELCVENINDKLFYMNVTSLAMFADTVRLAEREACKADCLKAAESSVKMYGSGAECISTVDECLRIIDERSNAKRKI